MMRIAAFILLLLVSPVSASEGEWWYQQAQVLYQEGDLNRSLALLEEIPKRFSKDQALVLKAKVLAAKILYEEKAYDRVLEVLKPLLNETMLPPDGLLVLAKSCEAKGLFDEALIYVNLLKKHYPDFSRCEASLIEARIYERRRLYKKTRHLAEGVLKSDCRLPLKAEALSLLLRNGGALKGYLSFITAHPEVCYYHPDILRELALYHLKQGALKRAEKEIYQYLNYSGREKDAPSLLFRLAEAYFARKSYREARRIYELVFTSWPYTKEAALAKFRLYYMRYLFEEKIGHKTAYTRRILLAICRRLKKDFPKEPLTEEAHALEIRLLMEDRRPEEALSSIWEFLKRYPQSSYLSQVYTVLCQASSMVDQKFLGQKDYLGLVAFHTAHAAAFEAARCGLHFYWLAQAYQGLNLYGETLLSLLQARDFGVPKPWEPDLLLNLADLLLRRGESDDLDLAQGLLTKVEKEFPEVSRSPYYLFLRGELSFKRGHFPEALGPLKAALRRTADEDLRLQVHELYLEALLRSGRLEEALALLQKEKDPKPMFLKRLALLALLNERLSLASEITALLQKAAPDDDEALWLRALVLERLGEEKKAEKIWALLAQKDSVYAKLASGLVRASSLVEQARREIY